MRLKNFVIENLLSYLLTYRQQNDKNDRSYFNFWLTSFFLNFRLQSIDKLFPP